MAAMHRAAICSAAGLALLACGDGPPGMTDEPDAETLPPPPDAAPPPIDAAPLPTNLVLRGTFELPIAGDVAADPARDLVVISEWFNDAVSFIDVSDPAKPVRIGRLEDIGYNSDVQIKGDRLYINHEPVDEAGALPYGIRIYDISDPENPVRTGTVGESVHPGLSSCHNLWPQPDRDLLYCASTATGEVIVLSTGETGAGTPDAPVFVAAISSPGGECQIAHDMYARGNRLYIAWLCDGFAIYDMGAPTIPVRKAQHNYADSFTHNIWPTDDDQYVLTTDETFGGHVRVWDIRDLGAIEQVGEYQPQPGAIVHNVEVVGTTAFIAHYTAGVYAVDFSDPTTPAPIGGEDFYDGPDGTKKDPFQGFQGAWGVEPALPYVYISSIDSGLRIYELVAE